MNAKTVLHRFILLLIPLAISCNDPSLNFSGITETNNIGEVIGHVDSSDWLLDERWSQNELALFPDIDKNALNNDGKSVPEDFMSKVLGKGRVGLPAEYIGPAYPNPATTGVAVHVSIKESEDRAIVLVDKNFNVLVRMNNFYSVDLIFDPIIASAAFFQIPDESKVEVRAGATYRFYYYFKFSDSDYYLKGHGDILIK